MSLGFSYVVPVERLRTFLGSYLNPQAAGRQCVGLSREARRDEPGREGTLQLVPIARDYSRASQSF